MWSFNILKAEENGNIKKKHSELVQRQQQVKSMISLEKISSFAVLNINKLDSWFWIEGKLSSFSLLALRQVPKDALKSTSFFLICVSSAEKPPKLRSRSVAKNYQKFTEEKKNNNNYNKEYEND